MTYDKRTYETQCKVKTLKTDTEEINQWKKIKTQSINVREQHSKYKVLFHNSNDIRIGNVRSCVRFRMVGL